MKAIKSKNTTNQGKQLTLKSLILLFLLFIGNTNAQEIIRLRSGAIISAKVFEIDDTQIKYKNFDNQDGPLYMISKSTVLSVSYQNGSIDDFSAYQSPDNQAKKTEEDSSDFAKMKQKSFGGPRIGVTFITDGSTSSAIRLAGKEPVLTQFGWQFEKRLFTLSSGLSGVIEFVPLISGVEKGGIPSLSASALIGLRGIGFKKQKRFEFAVGPTLARVYEQYTQSYFNQYTQVYEVGNVTYVRKTAVGIVLAAGLNFVKENVNFPITLAYSPSVGNIDKGVPTKKYQTGHRISLLVGFNYRKK